MGKLLFEVFITFMILFFAYVGILLLYFSFKDIKNRRVSCFTGCIFLWGAWYTLHGITLSEITSFDNAVYTLTGTLMGISARGIYRIIKNNKLR